jgi:hypothetical protein
MPDIRMMPAGLDLLQKLEWMIEQLAANRSMTVEEFCADSRGSDMMAYRIVAEVPALIAELRRLRKLDFEKD